MDWMSSLSWEWAIAARICIGLVICQGFLIKWVASQGRRTERFLWQFGFAFLIAVVFAAFNWNAITFGAWFYAALGTGFVASLGTYYQWKAMAISQSRNALFTFWDDIIAMTLAVIFLGESNFLTPQVSFGIGLSFLSLFLFLRHAWSKKRGETNSITIEQYAQLIRAVAIYSVLWGVAFFVQRTWAFNGFSVPEFLLAWYGGAFIASMVIYRIFRGGEVRSPPIDRRGLALVFVLALCIFSSMAFALISYKAPQVVVQPIMFIAEMIIPAMIGVTFWREKFDPIEWVYFAVGLTGSLLVGFGFH